MTRRLLLALSLTGGAFAGPPGAPDGGAKAKPAHVHHHTAALPAGEALSGASIYQLPGEWRTRAAKVTTLRALAGRPQVLAMIYTRCQVVCPRIVSDVVKIERELPAGLAGKVGFTLVSFDPDRDTPAVLAAYAKARGIDRPGWTLLTAPEARVRELSVLLGVKYKPDGRGDFAHSNIITILDAEGVIQHQQVGLGEDDARTVQVLTQLVGGTR